MLRYFILLGRFDLLLPGGELLLPLFFQDGGGALHGGSGAAQFFIPKLGAHPAVAALQKRLLLCHQLHRLAGKLHIGVQGLCGAAGPRKRPR